MEQPFNKVHTSPVYYRLIALWVVCEALLGGIIHGLKLPVSGLIVGSSAVICICLIAWHVPSKGAILKATLIVAIFKMMLSPHSPLPAYFAVFFQGLMGELLFFRRINYRISCVLLAVIALLESALQRILVVTILYGKDIWIAVNDFIAGFTKDAGDYSYWLVLFYISVHCITGLFIGWFAASLPRRIRSWNNGELLIGQGEATIKAGEKKRNRVKPVFFIIWLLLIFLLVQPHIGLGAPILSNGRIVQILVRSVCLLLTWYFLLSPLLTRLLKNWLEAKQKRSAPAIAAVTTLLPSLQFIVLQSWQLSAARKGIGRLLFFCRMVLVNTLYHA